MTLQLATIGVLIFIAGFIDSVAGGGGLISLPAIAILTGEGVAAVATNKVLAVTSALAALIVYWLHGHVRLKKSLIFVLFVGLGGFLGARVGAYLTPQIFRWLVILIFPFMLVVILKRESITRSSMGKENSSVFLLIAIGIFCGFYDGAFGPGGGTLMFLSLAVLARMPLLEAVASSKIANAFSALSSLTTYALEDKVQWRIGLSLAVCILVGAVLGSRLASTKAQAIIRPVLVLVVSILVIKIIFL